MACSSIESSRAGPRIGRRRFLELVGGGLAWLATGVRPASAAPYRVGVGKADDPYAATLRAVQASGEWPSSKIFGNPVVIKPNLVVPMTAESGATTDPEVVRAIVDLALEAGAAEVSIIEGGFGGANFSACGYEFFHGYDPRVRLIDLNDEPVALGRVPGGLAYAQIYMSNLLLADDVVFISAAKLKTHRHTHATLSMKNLIGLAPIEKYRIPPEEWRWVMHHRGISQVIVDLNLIRPIDYAVVDGMWGMEGDGPVVGDPVLMGMVIAGKNAAAVDRVCLKATGLPQGGVRHLTYAARKNMGPKNLYDIDVLGDPLTQRLFKWPTGLPPLIEYPRLFPKEFAPNAGQEVYILYWILPLPYWRRVDIVRTSDLSPEVTHVHVLRDWEQRSPGYELLKWDGRDDDGTLVEPGLYCARIQAKYSDDGIDAYASGWVEVM